jgi:hypothetical protein
MMLNKSHMYIVTLEVVHDQLKLLCVYSVQVCDQIKLVQSVCQPCLRISTYSKASMAAIDERFIHASASLLSAWLCFEQTSLKLTPQFRSETRNSLVAVSLGRHRTCVHSLVNSINILWKACRNDRVLRSNSTHTMRWNIHA